MSSLIQKVRDNELTPEQALNLSLKHSSDMREIDLDLKVDPLLSGFTVLDESEYLIRNKGRLIVLAGLPGCGKTALALQLASNIARRGRVLLFSFEMSKELLKERNLASLSRVPIKDLRFKHNSHEVVSASKVQDTLKLSIIDDPGMTINDAIQAAIDENQRERLELVVIDYLGLFEVEDKNRPIEMGRVAEALKFRLADKLKIPVIVLSQLNDEFEKRYNQFQVAQEKAKFFDSYKPIKNAIRPVLSDLAETRKLGRAADLVWFLHRPYLFDKSLDPGTTEIYTAKNRHGPAVDFNLEYDGPLTRFFNPSDF